ncbi:response regulator transcription factor [Anaerococcus sp. AGMB00486]|uniref:Response regulator transcription factor n=2 Tax=Anaerococcus TaxID=165779 RepID=A0ABX2NA78_9FIRM|nr:MULTISPECIES: response regulator transcription factor [Anaerococcus]MSS77707.1 response regulator transcription factor [Anaerococcus porci]NVF11563.1 response regulator transcription factor [Anaerococcus faecalis]
MKILLVEDDKKIGEELSFQLELLGYKTSRVENFEKVIDDFNKSDFSLVIMDLKLPYKNGFYWTSEIRKVSKVPIIFLTSASDDINLISAINYGADDFIAKPFSMQVLHSKIIAILRRSFDFNDVDDLKLKYENLVLDRDKMILEIDSKSIALSKNEFLIMEILLESPRKIVSREKIMDKLWATESFIDDNTLTVNINRIRKKIKALGLDNLIHTKKGVGYYIK